MNEPRDDELREDAAVFDVVRVGRGGSGRSTLAALALALSVGGLVVAGALDGPGARGPADAPAATAATAMRDVPATRVLPAPRATPAPAVANPLIALHTRAWGRYVFVHADVFTIDAEVVTVSILDARDEVVDTKQIDMPKGSTALRLGANDRFQLAFEVDGLAATEVAYVLANLYDGAGRWIAAEQQWLIPPSDPGWWRAEATAAEVPIVRSDPGHDLVLAIRRPPEGVFIQGIVRSDGVAGVFVNLVNSEGRVAGWSRVPAPGDVSPGSGADAFRFDVELRMPDWSHGPLWVQATAYDGSGLVVAQEQLGVWPDGAPMTGSKHALADPGYVPVPDAAGAAG